jgi:hypothetical protein
MIWASSGDVEVFQQGGDRVPDMVNRDHANVVLLADPAERADEVSRLDRAASPAGEDQVSTGPGRAHIQAAAGWHGGVVSCLRVQAQVLNADDLVGLVRGQRVPDRDAVGWHVQFVGAWERIIGREGSASAGTGSSSR